jgi:dienelactone hydrolase
MQFLPASRRLLALLAWAVAAIAACSVAHAEVARCPDGKPADGIQRAGDARHCVVIWRQEPARPSASLLVVYLHGDNGGRIDLKNDRGTAAGLADTLKAVTISIQRPGYVSDLGTSDGFSGGAGDDDYTAANVELLADVLRNLRSLNPGKKILLVGHSGGSAITALLASRFPGSADAYLLAGCPCDIAPWRVWRNSSANRSGTWSRSLSPQDELVKMPPETLIGIVVGNRDENTLPKFSEAYARALQARGVKTRVTYAMGATHASVRWSPEFLGVAQELADRLAK